MSAVARMQYVPIAYSSADFGGCCISAHERKSHIITGSTGATHLRIPVGNNVTSVLSIVLHVVPRKTDTPLWPRKSRNSFLVLSFSLSLFCSNSFLCLSFHVNTPDRFVASHDLDSMTAEECRNRGISCGNSLTIRRSDRVMKIVLELIK